MFRASFVLLTALGLVVACSSDDDSGSTTASDVESNQPGGGNADDGAGGSANAGDEAAGGSATTGAGDDGAADAPSSNADEPSGNDEGTAEDIGLDPGAGGADDGSASGDDGSDEGAAGTMMATAGAAGSAGDEPAEPGDQDPMSFFVTSRGGGNGGDFGGVEGADAFCAMLAAESPLNVSGKTWHAYLSTSTENARDRIGDGPWVNFAGVVVANDVDQLHDQAANGSLNDTWGMNNANIALDEQGDPIAAQPVLHDILTGSNLDGTVSDAGTCSDWTSQMGGTQNGHSNRAGGGQNPSSWNSAHATGCGEPGAGQNFQQGTVSQGGGRGSIYCFAID